MPTYFLSLFPIPSVHAKQIEKLQKDFLWDSLGNEFKLHLVIWKKIYESIQHDGLRIRSSVSFNLVLLGKWLLRFAMEKDVFSRKGWTKNT